MTWDAYNRRREALREVLAVADSHREDANPSKLMTEVEAANSTFGCVVELMLDVQMNWFQRLSGQLDRAFAEGVDDLEESIIKAWSDAAAQMPGARALIDASEDMPELQRALTNEYVFLARSAGVPSYHPDLVGHGQRMRSAAKVQLVDVPVVPDTPAGLFARIREAFAA